MKKFILIFQIVFLAPFLALSGSDTSESAGLILLNAPTARSMALSGAFGAVQNDVGTLAFNPSLLSSLQTSQASFLYEKGNLDDAFSQVLLGRPTAKGTWGLGVNYYNGGEFEVFDGAQTRNVTAQEDLTVTLGYGVQLKNFSAGLNVKYISSELIESAQASAFAIDYGVSAPIGQRFMVGAAIQNFGTSLKYVDEKNELPRLARASGAMTLFSNGLPTLLLLDIPYFMNEKQFEPAIGLETRLGPLAGRVGMTRREEGREFTAGIGVSLGAASLDYAMGLVDNLSTKNQFSVSYHFGGNVATEKNKPFLTNIPHEMKEKEWTSSSPRYVNRLGDPK